MINVDLTDDEAELFVALRRVRFFELNDCDIVIHKNKEGKFTDIKKSCVKTKDIFANLYRRQKALDTQVG